MGQVVLQIFESSNLLTLLSETFARIFWLTLIKRFSQMIKIVIIYGVITIPLLLNLVLLPDYIIFIFGTLGTI